MKCDGTRDRPIESHGLTRRLARRLHLLRCPACRAEAARERAIARALSDLPRSVPPTDLLVAVLSIPEQAGRAPAARKERTGMRRLAYVTAFLVAIGLLVGGGLVFKPNQPDGRSLLISAAQAMDEVLVSCGTIRVEGRPSLRAPYPFGTLYDGYYQKTYAPGGFRWAYYHADGSLEHLVVGRVDEGVAWLYIPGRSVAIRYDMGQDELRAYAEECRERFLDGSLWFWKDMELDREVRAYDSTFGGQRVTVVDVGWGNASFPEHEGKAEYLLDAEDGHVLGLRKYAAPSRGGSLVEEITRIQYGVPVSDDTFDFAPPRGVDVLEGEYQIIGPGELYLYGLEWTEGLASPETTGIHVVAGDLKDRAAVGLAPWSAVEDAYLAVLEEDPGHSDVLRHLGRMYSRLGRHEEALAFLPDDGGFGWASLYRAFSLDALGRRDEALDLYRQLEKDGWCDSIRAWAALGLQQPTWLKDLDIRPGPGEVRLKPTAAWKPSASVSDTERRALPPLAIDGDPATRWGTGGSNTRGEYGQEPGQWFELDFGRSTVVSRVVLDHQGTGSFYTSDWPRGLEGEISSDGRTWREVPVDQAGPGRPAVLQLPSPALVRAVRFTLTENNVVESWAIHEIYVFAPAS